MRDFKLHIGLLPRIIIAIILGIGAGYLLPDCINRIFITFNAMFSQFLSFCIPLIIIGFVSTAIGEIGAKAGKMLLYTALIAYTATFLAATLSYFTGIITFPYLLSSAAIEHTAVADNSLLPYFVINMPPVLDVMSALVLSFIIGLGIAYFKAESALRSCFIEFKEIIVKVIRVVIIPLLPLYIFGIFLNMTVSGHVGSILATFIKIIAVIFIIHIVVLLLQFTVASFFSKNSKNPLRLLGTMMPAYFTALGTQSSAATIPVTLGQTLRLGVNKDVAGFVVPLCANMHMSGSALKITACALALMMTQGIPYDTPMFFGFIAMLGVTMVASPGVPGGSIMASLGILSSILGFTDADNALMIALYIAMDSFGTACNVTGDGALTVIIDRIFSRKD